VSPVRGGERGAEQRKTQDLGVQQRWEGAPIREPPMTI